MSISSKCFNQVRHYFLIIINFFQKKPLKVFYKNGDSKDFAKFVGKYLCLSLFINKVAGLKPATLLKKETLARVFSCEFSKIFKNTFLTERLRVPPSASLL